ncbi:ABC transporter ATP-binding protein [Enterovirga aerilata]|uniref:Spermidine/putrescine import ATP-binding protein PotA n=1 Tax=Enterovirga aerilata TaxID=2730920 RepID=A0A849IJR7_9HYPH|nr:ABC transporter ATP-binding protein [Enterovirga sp. DB1703]NNM74183.1 ABC transporter ATP-binding protein [Enterovirga sp. DB1703]
MADAVPLPAGRTQETGVPLAAPSILAEAEISVSIRGITKSFGSTRALDAANLDIRRGEFFSLLGPSGCGKTTLLRIIGGFETPTSGDLLIAGRSALGDLPYRRRTNMVFQHGALFPHLTVAQNIAFGLEMKRVPRPEIARKVEEALALVRLSGYGDRKIDQLSGGQRQRIAMARALVNDPEVLLLDEPLGALDLQLRLQMQEELRRLHRAIGGTFIFVTHDQGEAITMSDRIAVMNAGRIQQVGTPREVYERPANRFVAEFMGHSNFYDGTVAGRKADGTGAVAVNGQAFPTRLPPDAMLGAKVFVALRYEKVDVVPEGRPGEGGAALDGTVEEESYMGSFVRRRVNLGPMGTIVSDAANTGRQETMRPGDRVRVRWGLDSATVLPA